MPQKEKIHAYVDAEVYRAFRDYVFAKYGTLNKYLGEELTKAMAEYLRDSRNAHTQSLQHILSKPNKKHLSLFMWLLKPRGMRINQNCKVEEGMVKNLVDTSC